MGVGRRGGRNGGSRRPLAQQFAAIMAAKGIYGFDASRVNLSGGNIASLIDWKDGSLAPVTGTVAAPTADAAVANAPTIAWPGVAVYARSSRSALDFAELHKANNVEVRTVYVPLTNTPIPVTTRQTSGGTGYTEYWTANTVNSYVSNLAVVVGGASRTANANVAVQTRYRAGGGVFFWKASGQAETGAAFGSAATGAPEVSLTIGSDTGASGTHRFRCSFAWLGLTAAEIAIIDAYFLATTGTSP